MLNRIFQKADSIIIGAAGGLAIGGLWLPAAVLFGISRTGQQEFKRAAGQIKARIGEQEYYARKLLDDYVKDMQAIENAGNWWKPLGLRRQPETFAECKRAYRKKILQVHPDRGGSKAKMQRVTAAYEIAKKAFKQ